MLQQAPPPSLPAVSTEPSGLLQRLALQRVLGSGEWAIIREYWELLNRVPGTGGQFEPAGELDPGKADSIAAGVRQSLEALNPSGETGGMWRAVETAGLLVETRALRLSRVNPMLLTRMMPAWTLTMSDNLLYDLDARLRELEKLRTDGGISEEVIAAASDTLYRQFECWALLQTVGDQRGYMAYPQEERLMEIELLYRSLAEEFGEERLQGFREMRPYLAPLLSDLMDGLH